MKQADFAADSTVVSTVLDTMKTAFKGRKLYFATTIWAHMHCGYNEGPLQEYVPAGNPYQW